MGLPQPFGSEIANWWPMGWIQLQKYFVWSLHCILKFGFVAKRFCIKISRAFAFKINFDIWTLWVKKKIPLAYLRVASCGCAAQVLYALEKGRHLSCPDHTETASPNRGVCGLWISEFSTSTFRTLQTRKDDLVRRKSTKFQNILEATTLSTCAGVWSRWQCLHQ